MNFCPDLTHPYYILTFPYYYHRYMALLLRAQLFTKLFSMIWIVLFQILQSITNPEQPFLILKRLLRIQVLTDLGKGAGKYIQSPKQAKVDVFPASRYHWTFCF